MSQSRAVRIEGAGGVEVLKLEEVARPEPGPDQVLVEIAAAGLNRADCLQRRGFYPAPEGTVPDIPGLEYAGTVCALGTGASKWSIGDRVMGICAGGSMATHIAVHQDTALAVPEGMDLTLHWHISEPDLSDKELDLIVTFMKTLSDDKFMPQVPSHVPSGLPL